MLSPACIIPVSLSFFLASPVQHCSPPQLVHSPSSRNHSKMPESGSQYVPLDGSAQPNWMSSMMTEPGHRKKVVIFALVAIVAVAVVVGSIIYVKNHETPVNPDHSTTTTAPATTTTPWTTTSTTPASNTTTQSPSTTSTTPASNITTQSPSTTSTTPSSKTTTSTSASPSTSTTAKTNPTITTESLKTSTTRKPHTKSNKHKNIDIVDDKPRDVIIVTSEVPSTQKPSKAKDDGVFY